MALWKKPNGTEIETNDNAENIAYVEGLGWKRLDKTTKGDPEAKAKVKKIKSKASIANPDANPKQMNNDKD